MTRLALGFYGHPGHLVAGCSRAGFPAATDLILLRAAASFAATGLRAARLVEEREQALRAKDEFLAMLGHELRNPLAPIVTALGVMRAAQGRDDLPRAARSSSGRSRHLAGLVNDLLDVTRDRARQGRAAAERVEIAEVVAPRVEMASPLLEQRRHHFVLSMGAGDRARVERRSASG